ncbi:MAG TPA: replicative DNA helicase [Candidatus Fimihabitans intestinipullorum]|uniref:Replicative DNA helicase n=1 Tax=Candidatus Fimihabitans intestinipullorum TaxID=2840820 RepID=A0A9D1HTY4_9BACT|nr:replicative DNA helicase [Candidatus Fimihabitans intestinipullorum]
MADRVMPHNLEAEQSVLGSMFLSKYAAEKCMESLQKELFYSEAHGRIFQAMSDLVEAGKALDITTLTAELDRKKWLSQVGGVEYISELVNIVPSAANIDQYIAIVEENAIKRRLIEEATQIVTDGYQSTEQLSDLLDRAEMKILNVVKTRKGTEFRSIQDVLFKAQQDLEKLAQTKGEVTGLSTGFYDIDKLTSGLHPNELIIIAARPAMGKTAFAVNLAMNVAMNQDKAVALFNMEMSAEQLAMRMLASAGQIDQNKLKTGRLEHNDWKRVNEAISRLADSNLFIDDTPGMTIGEIRAKCRRLASSENGLSMVVIDYLQLINGSAKYAGQRQQEVSEISRSLKTMAMELGIPVIALAQLSRSVEGREDKRPLLSDLRESGSIEQDADIVAFLYRDDYYNKEAAIDENTSKSEFIVSKHRSGPTATIELIFRRNTATFVNYVNREEN